MLAADWQCPHFPDVGIEVFNDDGETLGYLGGTKFEGFETFAGRLACLLPFLDARVNEIKPLSKLGPRTLYPVFKVALTLLDGNPSRDDLLSSMDRILSIPQVDRPTLVSNGFLTLDNLHGAISDSARMPYRGNRGGRKGALDHASDYYKQRERMLEERQNDVRKMLDGFLAMLEERFARAASKPQTVEELGQLVPDHADEFARFKLSCKQVYGVTPARMLRNRGIIGQRTNPKSVPAGRRRGGEKGNVDWEEVDRLLEERDALAVEVTRMEDQYASQMEERSERKQELSVRKQNLDVTLSSLEHELSLCGLFSGKRKRELRKRITEVREDIAQAKEHIARIERELRTLEESRSHHTEGLRGRLHDVEQRLKKAAQDRYAGTGS